MDPFFSVCIFLIANRTPDVETSKLQSESLLSAKRPLSKFPSFAMPALDGGTPLLEAEFFGERLHVEPVNTTLSAFHFFLFVWIITQAGKMFIDKPLTGSIMFYHVLSLLLSTAPCYHVLIKQLALVCLGRTGHFPERWRQGHHRSFAVRLNLGER